MEENRNRQKRKRPLSYAISPDNPPEAEEQIRLVVWMTKKGILHTASANGGKRSLLEAIKFKRMGVSAGFPDIHIPMSRKGHHGLYIELKRKKGGVISDSQKWWIDALNREGNLAVVCKGYDEAVKVLEEYFS